MSFPAVFALILLLGFINTIQSEFFDSDNVTMMFFYGSKRTDVVTYPLAEAEKLLDDPHFNGENIVFYIQDYHETQYEGYRQYIMVDAYVKTEMFNLLAIDWGTGYVSLDNLKDPDLLTLVPMVTEFLIKLHERTDWDQFSGLAYARGVEFMHFVAKDLFNKAGIRIPRVTQLAPQTYYMTEPDDGEIIPEFVDIIHTDIGNHENVVSNAHVEFFPNSGVDPQPGCPADSGRLDVCSRQRAKLLWGETLIKPYAICAFKADSYDDYEMEEPDQDLAVLMGIYCPTWARGKYYLRTNAESPYGRGCPQVDEDAE